MLRFNDLNHLPQQARKSNYLIKAKQQQKQFKKNNSNPYTSQINKVNEWSKEDF